MSRILPPGIPVEKIEGIYKQELGKLSDRLISQLHEFVQVPLEPSVESAEVQVFPDEYCEGASSIWMYFGGQQTRRIEDDDPSLCAGKSLELYSDFSSLPTLDLSAYDEEELEFPYMLVDLLIQWLAECWWKAGGWYYPVPVTIAGHDGFGSLDIDLTEKKP